MNFLKQYGDTEGPLGLPMKDAQAKQLETLLKTLPSEDRKINRIVTAKIAETMDGERSDVSWITTDSIDCDKEILIPAGMDESYFASNPMVTLSHNYWAPPVGKSLWRKRATDGPMSGIKAKTQYPARPDGWTDEYWPPDSAFALVKAGLMNGKSVGFITLKSHQPTPEEIANSPILSTVRRIIDEWALMEYACTWMPCNGDALLTEVSKANISVPKDWLPKPTMPKIPFTALSEIEKAVKSIFARINPKAMIEQSVIDAYAKLRGRV